MGGKHWTVIKEVRVGPHKGYKLKDEKQLNRRKDMVHEAHLLVFDHII